jgi:hypothetical protein
MDYKSQLVMKIISGKVLVILELRQKKAKGATA